MMKPTLRQPRKLRELVGYTLQAKDGEIGKLEEIYFDDARWVARYFVVRTGNWLLGRRVLIVPTVISGVHEENQTLIVELTRGQIENCPPVNTELPVSRHYELEYYTYYGWEPYWHDDSFLGPAPHIPPTATPAPEEPEYPHLRSSDEVQGYAISASDGNVGHVEDFVLEEPGWKVIYLEVDTRNWLPGKHVLVAPAWIRQVDWAKREVGVDLPREAVKTAPPYDPHKLISRDYEVALYKHYAMNFAED